MPSTQSASVKDIVAELERRVEHYRKALIQIEDAAHDFGLADDEACDKIHTIAHEALRS